MPFKIRCLGDILDRGTRIAVADLRSAETGEWLRKNIRKPYLVFGGVVEGQDVRPDVSGGKILKNNADILMLDGRSLPAFMNVKSGPDLRIVLAAWPRALFSARFLLAWGRYLVRRRVKYAGIYKSGRQKWLALDMVNFKTRPLTSRLYVPEHWTLEDIAAICRQHQTPYVVLDGSGTEKISILTTDEGWKAVRTAADAFVSTQTARVYSLTGEPSVFPLSVGKSILARAKPPETAGGHPVPSAEDAFFIAAYRAVYFDGLQSGIPAEKSPAQQAAVKIPVALLDKARRAGCWRKRAGSLRGIH